jgi:hypothetical protein
VSFEVERRDGRQRAGRLELLDAWFIRPFGAVLRETAAPAIIRGRTSTADGPVLRRGRFDRIGAPPADHRRYRRL